MAIFDPFKIRHKPPSIFPTTVRTGHVFSVVAKFFFTICILISVAMIFSYIIFSGCSDYQSFADYRRFGRDTGISTTNSSAIVRKNQSSEATDISHIFFGIGGSIQTWRERSRYTELWWRPNNTRGFVWLDEEPPLNLTWLPTYPPYKVSADTSRFNYTCWYGTRSAIRMARIIKESFELGLTNVRWFVMGDDDTVFFVDNLITVLSKYDHNQMYYIGGNSESVEQAIVHSYAMAYGGGGIAISYPLAVELVKILDGCIDRYASLYGSDQKIEACISGIGVPLTKELGFHQVDMRGNPYGLLAAHPVAPLVSLHHLDYVDPIFPATTQIDALRRLISAYKADPSRILQHSFCHDQTRNWSVSVSWGYTIQIYPSLVTARELETPFLTFKSWRTSSSEPFTFDTRPISEDPCERPIVYFLDRVYEAGSNQTLTTYRKHVEVSDTQCESPEYLRVSSVEFIDISLAKWMPALWKMAPRRQSCEIINGKEDSEYVINVKIRHFNPFESVTPPS
ncbi:Glycosyltransferase [Hirschfeldia incana]|nr:Glycosyltransferase [Hirschfeldia incana]